MENLSPKISVIIPTYNRAYVLEKCLQALSNQDIDKAFYEIIVSDDGSQDETSTIVKNLSSVLPVRIQYLRQKNAGANAARNQAILSAEGSLLLFINDDTIATSHMLREHLRIHHQYPEETAVVLGRMTISPEVSKSVLAPLHLDASYDLWKGKEVLDWRAFYTCNVSVKKSFLDKFGVFEEKMRYHEDLELSERLSHYGLNVIYNPNALGYHEHRLKEEEYLKVAQREGQSLAIWFRKSPHLKEVLAGLGFYVGLPLHKRIKYVFADAIMNDYTKPLFLFLARFFSNRREIVALQIYKKVFQSIKRKAIRDELSKGV